jgi:hypothetical protein
MHWVRHLLVERNQCLIRLFAAKKGRTSAEIRVLAVFHTRGNIAEGNEVTLFLECGEK